jgi:hypothetical protein
MVGRVALGQLNPMQFRPPPPKIHETQHFVGGMLHIAMQLSLKKAVSMNNAYDEVAKAHDHVLEAYQS